jgi:hypothetical protein
MAFFVVIHVGWKGDWAREPAQLSALFCCRADAAIAAATSAAMAEAKV